MTEYIIVGDTKEFTDCLIYTCGTNKEHAEKVLHNMLHNPDENDLRKLATHTNIRIKETTSDKCWWNDSFLAN